jgi:hypothetical protein
LVIAGDSQRLKVCEHSQVTVLRLEVRVGHETPVACLIASELPFPP